MEKESTGGMMEESTQACGETTLCMAMALTSGSMAECIMDCIRMTRRMEEECTCGLMAELM